MWLDNDCGSFRIVDEDQKKNVLESSGGLPAVAAEWINEKIRRGRLTSQEFFDIASDVKQRKYSYLSKYIDTLEKETQGCKRMLYLLSVLPLLPKLTDFQITELVDNMDNIGCHCPTPVSDNAFVSRRQLNKETLEKAVEANILKNVDDGYAFQHETKQEYIRGLSEKFLVEPLNVAYKFSIMHAGFPSQDHPDTMMHLLNARLLLSKLQESKKVTSLKSPVSVLDAFLQALFTNFQNDELVLSLANNLWDNELPIHLKALALTFAILSASRKHTENIDKSLQEVLERWRNLTGFQIATIAKALTNATSDYGRLDKLEDMARCVDTSKEIFAEFKTPELALAYASALTNATLYYKRGGTEHKAEAALKKLKDFLEDKPVVRQALFELLGQK